MTPNEDKTTIADISTFNLRAPAAKLPACLVQYTGENIGRRFPIKEKMAFEFRAEFFNIFNRLFLPGPASGNPTAAVTRNSAGELTGGFGFVNANNAGGQRNAQFVGRFQF